MRLQIDMRHTIMAYVSGASDDNCLNRVYFIHHLLPEGIDSPMDGSHELRESMVFQGRPAEFGIGAYDNEVGELQKSGE